jgi:hypothetical protein
MSDNDRPGLDHSLLSPSGKVSSRARQAALRRAVVDIFGPEGLQPASVSQPSERETLVRQARELRDLAARGMSPRKCRKQAALLEARASKEIP